MRSQMGGVRRQGQGGSAQPAVSSLALGALGVAMAYFGSALGPVSLNILEVLGPAFFWVALLYFVLRFPLRSAASEFAGAVKTSLGAGAFAAYLAVHLLLYGFILDAILASIYGVSTFATDAGFLLTTNVYLPSSFISTAFDISYNPVVLMNVPPVFSAALSFYSIAVALVIGVLVVANIGKTRELGRLRTTGERAKNLFVLPAIGVVLGASSCISVAGIVELAAPSSILTSSDWIYYVTYFLFPVVAVVLLYLNLRSAERISLGARAS
ncbi:MAG: hypothetical protein JRM86_01010 [Nitrososphaerota archaeon]|nr:hypothetical protein [Nitrososphaerota archaeon]